MACVASEITIKLNLILCLFYSIYLQYSCMHAHESIYLLLAYIIFIFVLSMYTKCLINRCID